MAGELFTFQCIRGQGAIADYKDQTQYLNVPDKGAIVEEDSEEDDELDGEEE